MVVGENRAWALQGKGLEHSLPSGELGQILNTYLKDDFLNGRYSIGTRKPLMCFIAKWRKYTGFILAVLLFHPNRLRNPKSAPLHQPLPVILPHLLHSLFLGVF